MKNQYFIKFFLLSIILLIASMGKAQTNYTETQILWVCPDDPTVKLTYKIGLVDHEIVIRTPLDMDSTVSIIGTLTISDGSFEPIENNSIELHNFHKGPVKTKTLSVSHGYCDESYLYYGTENKPTVTFVGNCHKKGQEIKFPERNKAIIQDTSKKHFKVPHDPNNPHADGGRRG